MTSFLAHHGLWAVFVLMAIDAVFPAASELVMLYGGALASGALTHELDVFGTATDRASAPTSRSPLPGRSAICSARSAAGRSATTAAGRSSSGTAAGSTSAPERLERAERWFERWEGWAVLIGRLTPVVRSFVSIPGRGLRSAARAVTPC